ncbi:FGGY family carbohydrate kinase [Nocardioides sp. YIM 152315]|uniref:FGGY-family carbohydrate kinase n=1 Tax=Nocardioides sp. YIM 152315 TaxID=3031760 RepID=UPI0023DA332F|nr:FGGY family carbohydrate kinase [Nocardioides sp. YIM 152315]MDF1605776.1 FGGY family carbohydrate kinase [Nocardioides sp. YIM 152315]
MAPGPVVRVAGLDLGTSYVKTVGVDLDPASDRPVRVRELRRAPTPTGAAALVAVARRLLDEVADGAAGIGIASMAETGVPLDADDRPLTELLTWDARRPLSPTLAELDPVGLFARTGVRLSPKVPLATWAWLAREHPDVVRRTRRWAGAADLVALALTGTLATDHTLAGRTGAHLLDDSAWDADLLALAGVAHVGLPEVVSDRPVGRAAGIPVVVAGHDHQVGAHASGVSAPGDTANSLGTTEVVLRVLDGAPERAAVHAAGMSLVRTVGGARRALLAGNGSAGAAYAAWVADQGLDPDAVELPNGPSDLLVLPHLRGRQCPDPDPGARLRVVGDLGAATDGDRLRALLEGLALQTRWMDAVGRSLDPGAATGPFVVFGGPGARNDDWTRVKAEVLARPLRLVTQHEPVAIGAAIVAAERAGLVEPGSVALPTDSLPVHEDRYAAVLADFVREARRKDPA